MTLSLRKPPVALSSARAVPAQPQSGFTLIEIMFAMAIFAIGVMGLLAYVPVASNRVMKSGTQTRASSIAAEAAENLLTFPYGHGSLTAGTHDDPANPQDGNYYTRWVVENDQPLAACKRITITVARGAVSNAPAVRLVIVTPRSGG